MMCFLDIRQVVEVSTLSFYLFSIIKKDVFTFRLKKGKDMFTSNHDKRKEVFTYKHFPGLVRQLSVEAYNSLRNFFLVVTFQLV